MTAKKTRTRDPLSMTFKVPLDIAQEIQSVAELADRRYVKELVAEAAFEAVRGNVADIYMAKLQQRLKPMLAHGTHTRAAETE